MNIKSLAFLAVTCSFALAQTPVHSGKAVADSVSARARQIHDSALVIDTHADTPQRFLDEGFDIGSTDPSDLGHISLEKVKRGNLGAEFFSAPRLPRFTFSRLI